MRKWTKQQRGHIIPWSFLPKTLKTLLGGL
jgi:hypothetical protein